MSFACEDFVKLVPVTSGVLFQFSAVPEEGLEVWLENITAGNTITYKFQESDDGETWSDKTIDTAAGVGATTFVLTGAQAIHLTRTKVHARLLASAPANTYLAVKVSWKSNDSSPVKYLSV